jgi:hypothetical protein
VVHTPLLRRGLVLEYITLDWNVVGVVIVVAAAYTAYFVALAGFGFDSLIEIFASVVVVWQLTGVNVRGREAIHVLRESAGNDIADVPEGKSR